MRRDERGAMAIEVVVLTPLLVAAIMVIAAGGRYVDARGQVNGAAYAAARAASLAGNREVAVQAGTQAAEQSMSRRGLACANLTVSVDAADFNPGGDARATVRCVADLSDVVGVGGIPGSKTFTFAAVVPLEEHRDFQ